jgi:hypothetical protein
VRLTVAPDTYPHGTRARYVLEACRCEECRAASRVAARRSAKDRAYGRGGDVDAGPARAHVKALMRTGMGYKRIAEAAGVNSKTVYILLAGRSDRGTPPPKTIRRFTAERLLATRGTVVARQTVNALPYWHMVADLMGLGYSRSWVSGQLGQSGAALQLGKRYIHVVNAAKLSRLWHITTRPREAATPNERSAVTRARNDARTLRNRLAARAAKTPRPRSGQGTRRPDRELAR